MCCRPTSLFVPLTAVVSLLLGAGCPGDSLPRDTCPGGRCETGVPLKDNGAQDSLVIPPNCGNKKKEGKEECDDGNKDNTDDCLINCRLAYCGDGFVHKKVEQCDDGNQDDSDACSTGCKAHNFQVNAITVKDQRYPAVGIFSDGTVLVVWHDASALSPDSSGTAVRMRRFSLKGKALDSSDVLVPTTTSNDQRDPDVAVNAQDQALVVWTDWSVSGTTAGPSDIRGRLVSKGGTFGGADTRLNSTTKGNQSVPAVCATPGGGFVLVYNDTSKGSCCGFDVQAQRLTGQGTPTGSDFIVNTSSEGDQAWPDVAAATGGNVLVVWQTFSSEDKETSGYGIAGRVYNASGSAVTGEMILNSIGTNEQQNPAVAPSGTGGFVVVWDDTSGQGLDSTKQIRARWFSAGGSPQGVEVTANTATSGAQTQPDVATRSNQSLVVWEDPSQSSYGLDVRGRLYTGSAPQASSDFVVNTTRTVDQASPAVALAPGGMMVVVWESTSSKDNDGYGIQMRIFLPD